MQRLRDSLSDRDLAVLWSVERHRFLRTDHLLRLHFVDDMADVSAARTGRRSIRRLAKLGVIEHLERRIGGVRAGSASFIWRVGLTGDQLLRADPDEPRARRKEPSLRNLQHWLAIADVTIAARDLGRAGKLQITTLDLEPASWRAYLDKSVVRQILKPDLFLITTTDEFEDAWFIEVDRATESIPTVLKQCRAYTDYRRTGAEHDAGGVFPLVLWATVSQRHAERIRSAIDASRSIDSSHFKVCTLDEVAAVIAGGAA